MKLYIKNEDNTFSPLSTIGYITSADGEKHCTKATLFLDAMTAADRAEYNVFEPEEADPVPDGKKIVSTSVQDVDGTVKFVHELADITLAELKEQKNTLIRNKRKEKETTGFSYMGSPFPTDSVTQAKIQGAIALFEKDETLTAIDWEINNRCLDNG